MRITILTNGPGELWGWVRPVTAELRKRGHTISLWILPCQFASGHEREAASLLGVDKLEGPAGVSRIWHDIACEKTDRVIQLGGDIMFGLKMSKSADAPLTCYTYGPKKAYGGDNKVKILTAYKAQTKNIKGVQAIGDLTRDALDMDVTPSGIYGWNWPKIEGSPRVLIFPGSRPAIRHAALDWVSEVHECLKSRIPDLRVRALFSQFMPESEFDQWQKAGLNPIRAGAGVAMREADFAFTQPGTNNFEMMHCGLPGLVVAPEKFLKFVPVSGVWGFLADLPLLGLSLRKIALFRTIKKWNGVISLPNRIASSKIINEMYGDITPEDVAEEIAEELRNPDKLAKTSEELLKLSGRPGAASRLCDIVLSSNR
ncbi:MAG: cdisaccharide synthetase [Synergistaceae bacterium]|nr:cdisaccharide synthetase [Synergistaceae bacterium]